MPATKPIRQPKQISTDRHLKYDPNPPVVLAAIPANNSTYNWERHNLTYYRLNKFPKAGGRNLSNGKLSNAVWRAQTGICRFKRRNRSSKLPSKPVVRAVCSSISAMVRREFGGRSQESPFGTKHGTQPQPAQCLWRGVFPANRAVPVADNQPVKRQGRYFGGGFFARQLGGAVCFASRMSAIGHWWHKGFRPFARLRRSIKPCVSTGISAFSDGNRLSARLSQASFQASATGCRRGRTRWQVRVDVAPSGWFAAVGRAQMYGVQVRTAQKREQIQVSKWRRMNMPPDSSEQDDVAKPQCTGITRRELQWPNPRPQRQHCVLALAQTKESEQSAIMVISQRARIIHHSSNLRLLEHDFRKPDAIRVFDLPREVVATVLFLLADEPFGEGDRWDH